MFDWPAAEEALYRIAKKQLVQFFSGPDADDVYGVGFFCDAYTGSVYLVANTERYIGNWKNPGGLFSSSSVEQREFDAAWEAHRRSLSGINNDSKQGKLEAVCVDVLRRLFNEGAFATASRLIGFAVLGPDDRQDTVLEKRKRFDG